ncbi:hypothetical protein CAUPRSCDRAFT_12293 [Caulochytrium protostelioides]|uniref:Uncharacterized protein n=1 Tax=Caulochytrium protostelioides TaxID=1555241 RepID=A0A4P9WS84_9FUNG|nr:hypothetical protein CAUPRSCDRAFT_12293 [Caulochytrium protostelioides]
MVSSTGDAKATRTAGQPDLCDMIHGSIHEEIIAFLRQLGKYKRCDLAIKHSGAPGSYRQAAAMLVASTGRFRRARMFLMKNERRHRAWSPGGPRFTGVRAAVLAAPGPRSALLRLLRLRLRLRHPIANEGCCCMAMAWHDMASHRIASHRIASHRIASHRIASHRIASHRIASHRIASHRIASPPAAVDIPRAPAPAPAPALAPCPCRP